MGAAPVTFSVSAGFCEILPYTLKGSTDKFSDIILAHLFRPAIVNKSST